MTLSPFARRAADALADEVAALVRRRIVDYRDPVADALLDYRNPPSSPRADRIGQLEEQVAVLKAEVFRGEEQVAVLTADLDVLADERDKLSARNADLRQTIVNLTHSTPFPGEAEECRSQRAVLMAEVGTLRARVAELEAATTPPLQDATTMAELFKNDGEMWVIDRDEAPGGEPEETP